MINTSIFPNPVVSRQSSAQQHRALGLFALTSSLCLQGEEFGAGLALMQGMLETRAFAHVSNTFTLVLSRGTLILQ